MKTLELNLGGIRPLQADYSGVCLRLVCRSGYGSTGLLRWGQPQFLYLIRRDLYTARLHEYLPQAGFPGTGRKTQGQHFL